MPQEQFYRYFSHSAEWERLHRDRIIQSTNPYGGGRSWYTNERTADLVAIRARLALPSSPRFRVGPVPRDEMPDFDICDARRVEPGYGQPGGGLEYCTTEPVHLFGLYNLEESRWEPL